MNENSPNTPSQSASHHGLTAKAISRRAYELWEQEGRPENRDLHHWLRAEQELLAEMGKSGSSNTPAAESSSSQGNTDTQLQNRGGNMPNRNAGKRSTNPFPTESAGGRFSPPAKRSGGK